MDKKENTVTKGRMLWKILILLYCTVILGCVLFVLFNVFDPSLNSYKALGGTYMDIVSMAILTILVISLAFEKDEPGRTTKLFLGLMLGTKWALFFDFMTWSLDGTLEYGDWTFVFTIASLCSGAILGCIFVLYLSSYMIDVYGLKASWIRAKICAILNAIAFLLTITLAVTHQAFEFVDGHYTVGALYDVITVIPVLTLIYMTCYIIKHRKIIGAHDVIAVCVYIFIMIVGALIEAAYGIGTSYVSITIADVVIFVMLQNKLIERTKKQQEILAEKVDEEKKNVEKWIKKSNTDEVTGFFNRHAYEDDMFLIENEVRAENFVYVSMDVNGLKVVNDTLGHEAGDELIVGACSCMSKCFGQYGKLYRTGGDEFVALIYATEPQLEKLEKDFEQVTEEWHGKLIEYVTVSYGYVTQKEAGNMSLHQMAVLADKRMYENKTMYYRKKGIDRRGQKDAHVALCALYEKILKINITEDSYQIESVNNKDTAKESGFSESISKWLSDYATLGGVHPDDMEEYLSKTNLSYVSEYFKRGNKILRVFYRRKYDEVYKKVMLEMIPANDYKDESQNLYLYVKNIE